MRQLMNPHQEELLKSLRAESSEKLQDSIQSEKPELGRQDEVTLIVKPNFNKIKRN